MSNKWIKVKVPEKVHSNLRMEAFAIGKPFGEYVASLLGGVERSKDVGKVPLVERKDTVVSSQNPQQAVGVGRKCNECNLVVREWVYDRKGKEICVACAERLAGSNP